MKTLDWANFKSFVNARKLSIQWEDKDGNYELEAYDGPLARHCLLNKSVNLDDVADFETNFKPNGNKSIAMQTIPFAAKSLPNGKSLFKRFTGISQALTTGPNTFTWTQSNYPWTKFVGVEVLGGELGDTCDLYVLDTSTGTYSGVPNYPLNQFAFTANIAKDFYRHVSEYDADLYQNLQIKFVYTSVSNKTIYINFDMNEVK